MDERTTEVSDVRDKETAFEENLATREGTGDEMENKERHPSENFRDKASATLLELPVTANISLTYAEEACILRPIFLLKKAKGCPDWDRTAPMAMVEASVSTTKVREKSERARTGIEDILFFNSVKAVRAAVV